MVINLAPSNVRDGHWVAVSTDSNGQNTYFDSFGMSPPKNLCQKYKFKDHFRITVQPIYSNRCGFYCILFLYLSSLNLKMPQIQSVFRSLSDKQVELKVRRLAK